ncbi:MAG: dNTP triphosphohydrolase [Bacteroidetes bacterium]|nr:dNTP triphosphohydrolase [Bacteroidota bacterium]
MNWESLYSTRRSGDKPRQEANPDTARNSFIRDYDRIIFSSAFRRLQNKTQVFPLPGAVFVHNRLTHSLEVASVGRSLGKSVGDALAGKRFRNEEPHASFYRHELHSVIASACLAHDIGNPPFGHSGEDAIRSFFLELPPQQRRQLEDQLSPNQLADFDRFEGNANAFRTLTHHFNESEPGGYKLTYATLASIVKYPCISAEGFNKKTGRISLKKSGFFDTERECFRQLSETLNIPGLPGFQDAWARHPFVFLVEAADDVCYRIIDLEDTHRLGILSLQGFKDLFLPFFEQEQTPYNSLDYLQQKLHTIKDENQQVQFIRAKWIGLMVHKLSQVFQEREAELLAGSLEHSLTDCLTEDIQQLLRRVGDYSTEHVYRNKAVLEIEVAGFHIMGGLLRAFTDAVMQPKLQRSQKLLDLMPRQFPVQSGSLYLDLQSVVDFIAGMTDLYALDLYRKITGISIPELR